METKTIQFIGEYQVRLDAKGRFLFPSGFKKQLQEGEASFVLNRGFEKCLSLYPVQSWQPLFNNLSKLNDFDPEVRKFRRFFLNGATPVELDSAGRILIPKNLIEYAGLGKDVILNSSIDKIEIWNKDNYEEFFESFSPESFSDLAQKVMVPKEMEE